MAAACHGVNGVAHHIARVEHDLGEARFTLIQLPPAETPGFRTFVCQHHTRDIVWRPEYQRHANGSAGIQSVSVATSDPAPYARLFEGLPVTYAGAKASAIAAIRLRVDDSRSASDRRRANPCRDRRDARVALE